MAPFYTAYLAPAKMMKTSFVDIVDHLKQSMFFIPLLTQSYNENVAKSLPHQL